MPDTVAMPRKTFEAVLGGLLEIEELLAQLTHAARTSRGGSQGAAQSAGVRQLLQRYVTQVEEWIKSVTVAEEDEDEAAADAQGQAPMVMVGAVAQVMDPDTGEVFPIRIVGPNQGDRPAQEEQVVSVLSPIGQALLLARPGDTIRVAAPMGTLTYVVKSVGYPL